MFRAVIVKALEGECEICAEAVDAGQAAAVAEATQPDVCLVGRDIPGDGIRAVRDICEVAPGAAVLVLAERRDVDDLLAAVRAGAIGFVPSEVTSGQLRWIVRAVAAGEAVVPSSMLRDLMIELRYTTGGGDGRITRREAQVLGMVRRGNSTAAIAERLEISPVTVRRHIAELVDKLGMENRDALATSPPVVGRPADSAGPPAAG